jgi:hypothetical protein
MESRNLTGENIKPWKKPVWEGTFPEFWWTYCADAQMRYKQFPDFSGPIFLTWRDEGL